MADEQKKEEQQKKARPPKSEKAPVGEKPSAEAPRHAAKERPRLRVRFERLRERQRIRRLPVAAHLGLEP